MAADRTWTGGGSGNNWNTAGNWGGTAPVAGDALIFSGSTKAVGNTNNFTAGTAFAGITFASDAGAFTLAGTSWGQNGITLTGAITNNSANAQLITLPILLNATQTFDTGSAGINIGDNSSGIISGAGGITKTGSGTLTLNQTNTYTGATTISAGTLALSNGGRGSLASTNAVTIASGATFSLGLYSTTVGSIAGEGSVTGGNIVLTLGSNNLSADFAGDLKHSGSVVKNGTGIWSLSGTNTYAGATTINGGTIVFRKTSAKGNGTVTTVAAGSIGLGVGGSGYYTAANVAALFNTNTLTGFNLNASSGVAIDTSAGDFTQGTALTAARKLTKLGTNTLTFTTANTYSGGTVINAGKVLANNSSGSALGSGAATVAEGATLGGSGFISAATTIATGATLSPGANGVGTLTFTGGITFATGSILDFELGKDSSDKLVVSGALTGAGAETITVNLTDAGDFAAGTYTLIDGTGASFSSFDASTFKIGDTIEGYTFSFSRTGDLIQLIATTTVPEPSTYAALAGVFTLALSAGYRRRRSS